MKQNRNINKHGQRMPFDSLRGRRNRGRGGGAREARKKRMSLRRVNC